MSTINSSYRTKRNQINFEQSGRTISLSKSEYVSSHPDDHIIFNANIFTKEKGRIWVGDLNISQEIDELRRLARELQTELFIFTESDSRNNSEDKFDFYVVRIDQEGVLVRNGL